MHHDKNSALDGVVSVSAVCCQYQSISFSDNVLQRLIDSRASDLNVEPVDESWRRKCRSLVVKGVLMAGLAMDFGLPQRSFIAPATDQLS